MQSQGFLQSKEWANFQRSLGREVLEYSSSPSLGDSKLGLDKKDGISAKIIRHELPLGKSYLYIPHGPEMDPVVDFPKAASPQDLKYRKIHYGVDFNSMTGGFKNPVVNFVRWLRELSREQKAIFIKAEPLVDNVAQALAEHGFKKSKKEIQPSRTVIIDLSQSEDELLSRMHYKTRYNIKVAEGHRISVAESNDIDLFLKLLKKTTKRDKFSAHPDDYYRKLLGAPGLNTRLLLANASGEPVAGAIILTYGNTGYYLHGASDYDKRSSMAPYALHWHIIKQLKAEGLKQYDLWGINAREWPGVTRFKLGWGGRTLEYPGAFDLTLSRFWHFVYKVIKRS